MSSLQELKNKMLGSPTERKSNSKVSNKKGSTVFPKKTPPKVNTPPSLEIEEARYLLSLIAKTEFSGKDIQIVYNTALKLQDIIKNGLDGLESINKEDNNG